jgi:hypothetical protein
MRPPPQHHHHHDQHPHMRGYVYGIHSAPHDAVPLVVGLLPESTDWLHNRRSEGWTSPVQTTGIDPALLIRTPLHVTVCPLSFLGGVGCGGLLDHPVGGVGSGLAAGSMPRMREA